MLVCSSHKLRMIAQTQVIISACSTHKVPISVWPQDSAVSPQRPGNTDRKMTSAERGHLQSPCRGALTEVQDLLLQACKPCSGYEPGLRLLRPLVATEQELQLCGQEDFSSAAPMPFVAASCCCSTEEARVAPPCTGSGGPGAPTDTPCAEVSSTSRFQVPAAWMSRSCWARRRWRGGAASSGACAWGCALAAPRARPGRPASPRPPRRRRAPAMAPAAQRNGMERSGAALRRRPRLSATPAGRFPRAGPAHLPTWASCDNHRCFLRRNCAQDPIILLRSLSKVSPIPCTASNIMPRYLYCATHCNGTPPQDH